MVFLEQQLSAHNGHLLAFIVRRHAMLAMEGSVASAEFVAKVLGGQYTRTLSGAGIDTERSQPAVMTMNFLVPRPDYPQGTVCPPTPEPATPQLAKPSTRSPEPPTRVLSSGPAFCLRARDKTPTDAHGRYPEAPSGLVDTWRLLGT
jgi:hypothetical protein